MMKKLITSLLFTGAIAAAAIAQPGNFSLNSPSDGARVTVRPNNNTQINITWGSSSGAVGYKWVAGLPGQGFIVGIPSNNMGTATTLTLTEGAIDNLLETLGLSAGDSIELAWSVFAFSSPSDSTKANQTFAITLKRGGLGSFSLLSPPDGASVAVRPNNNSEIDITWETSANAGTYKWFAGLPGQSFLLAFASNNSGTDTELTLTEGAIDALLASLGLAAGDSVTLDWTVYAYQGTDSLQAGEIWSVTLKRGGLGTFSLLSPSNNASVTVRSGNNTPVVIDWANAANAQTYKWFAGLPGQSFLLNFASDNSGADSRLTLTEGAIDALLASLSLNPGDSVTLEWTVYAYQGADSLKANETWTVTLKRAAAVSGLTPFNLISPPNNATVSVRANNNNLVVISWEASATAVSYNWLAGLPGTDLNPALLVNPADNGGVSTQLSLTEGAVDALLASFGVGVGDSIMLGWTVHAYDANGDSLRANQIWNVILKRQRPVEAFNLSSPANNAVVPVFPAGTDDINITWTAAGRAVRYVWKARTPGGNFTAPLLSIPSNNGGTATTLTLQSGAVDAILAGAGLNRGDSITLEWTVYGFNADGDSARAEQIWNVILKREIGTALKSLSNSGISVFPNPAADVVNITLENGAGDTRVVLFDINGKVVRELNATHSGTLQLNVQGLSRGIYNGIVENSGQMSTFRISVQ